MSNLDIKFERLTPFKKCVLQNFPFIEADFDALTNYGLLCKIVEYLNQVIASQNEVQGATEEIANAFNNLYDYVHDYFENLDVQEEINNKLDAMVEDGTFQQVLDAYVTPTINAFEAEVNDTIDDLRGEVSALGSSRPIPVASTSDMTDHNSIYVNTTDGKWYYYDTSTSAWVAGGTYQSSGIGDGTVGGNALYNGDATPIYTMVQGYYRNNNGESVSNSSWEMMSDYIPFHTGDSYYLTNCRSTWCCLYDENKDFISTSTTGSGDPHTISGTLNTADVAYVRLQFPKNLTHVFEINGVDVFNKYSVDWLTVKSSNLDFTPDGLDGSSLKDDSVYRGKLILDNGEPIVKGSYWNYQIPSPYIDNRYQGWNRFENLIDVEIGDVITAKNVRGSWAILFDENGDAIGSAGNLSTITNATYTVANGVYKIGFNLADNVLANAQLFINDKPIYFDNGSRSTIDWLELNEEQKAQISKYDISRYQNYRVLFIGDSITEKNFRASTNWVDYITDELNISNYTNAGMSGTGILRTFGNNPNWLTALPTYDDNYDMVLIMGDMNDWSNEVFTSANVGQYGDSTTDTFYGTMKTYLESILTKYPLAKIGWITSTPRNQQIGETSDYLHGKSSIFETANSVIKEMCNNYSIPVLELYEESSLYPWITANNNEFFKPDEGSYVADAIHPNSKGQRIMAYKIKDFIIRNF